jgi:hypothetical protein
MRKDERNEVFGTVRQQPVPAESQANAAAKRMVTSRRELLKNAGRGMAAGGILGHYR